MTLKPRSPASSCDRIAAHDKVCTAKKVAAATSPHDSRNQPRRRNHAVPTVAAVSAAAGVTGHSLLVSAVAAVKAPPGLACSHLSVVDLLLYCSAGDEAVDGHRTPLTNAPRTLTSLQQMKHMVGGCSPGPDHSLAHTDKSPPCLHSPLHKPARKLSPAGMHCAAAIVNSGSFIVTIHTHTCHCLEVAGAGKGDQARKHK
jgi:hypothetical protein